MYRLILINAKLKTGISEFEHPKWSRDAATKMVAITFPIILISYMQGYKE